MLGTPVQRYARITADLKLDRNVQRSFTLVIKNVTTVIVDVLMIEVVRLRINLLTKSFNKGARFSQDELFYFL